MPKNLMYSTHPNFLNRMQALIWFSMSNEYNQDLNSNKKKVRPSKMSEKEKNLNDILSNINLIVEQEEDLDNNKFYQHDHLANSFWEGSIDTVKLYENAVEVIVGNASFSVISKDNSSESEVFIVEYQESSYTEGFFSMYEDFDCDSK